MHFYLLILYLIDSDEIKNGDQNRLFWTSDEMNTGYLGNDRWTRVFWTDQNGKDFSGWTKMDDNFINGQKWSRVFWTDKDNKEYTGWSKVDSSFIKPEKFRFQFPWRQHKATNQKYLPNEIFLSIVVINF